MVIAIPTGATSSAEGQEYIGPAVALPVIASSSRHVPPALVKQCRVKYAVLFDSAVL